MQLRSGKRKIDAYQPTFDPNLDIATVVFSHVQCVGTRLRLATVSKLWRDASKLAAGYPRRFDLNLAGVGRFKETDWRKYSFLIDNDEALSLPREQVFELLESIRVRGGTPWSPHPLTPLENLLPFAAIIGSVRMLKWARENDMHWPPRSIDYAWLAAYHGHLPALQWLHENGCPMDKPSLCHYAADNKHWDCLQYLVDNKCPGWEDFALPRGIPPALLAVLTA